MPTGHYGVILCDPPWAFRAYRNERAIAQRSAQSHYHVQTLDELETMPVASLAAPSCALFMWAVDSHLDQAIKLMQAWGFTFKTIAFIWVKTTKGGQPRMSMGLWTRKQAEICIMGTRGRPARKATGGGVRQVIMAQRREHSRKPDEQYERIEALVAGPYLELFARQRRPGWTAWGNEVDRFTASPADIETPQLRRLRRAAA